MSEEYREYAEIVHLVWPDWQVTEKIGSGAFATVFRASRRDGIAGEKDAAVKVIRIPNSDGDWDLVLAEGKTPEQAESFFREVVDDSLKEIRAMEELSGNTNIVSIFDYKVHKVPDRPVWYILIRMEYLQKVDTTSFGEDEIIRLGTDVCTALSICRKKNIVHRDVSLDNVFLHDGNYKLGDFGVAKVLEGTMGTMHTIAGKPLYMAPEVYNASLEDTDIDSAAKVDIYSLGILMYRLANNMKYPFEDTEQEHTSPKERNQAFRRRIIDSEELPAPKNVSPGLAAVILKACMASPDKRYASADAMKEDLLSLAKNRNPKPARRIRKTAAWICAALAVLAFAYFFLLKPVLFPEWTEWSDWTEIRQEITDPDQMQEEEKDLYEWMTVRCPGCPAYNSIRHSVCRVCKTSLSDSELLKQVTEDSVSQVIEGEAGGRIFDGIPYWYVGTVTKYRYRTRIQKEKNQTPGGEDAFCHDWYFSTYEDSEDYPGIVFKADGGDRYFSVTKGERLYLIEHRYGEADSTREASVEDGVLTAGWKKYSLEDGKLVYRYGAVTETYAREPREPQVPVNLTAVYPNTVRPEYYNGTWIIEKFGTQNAYADAESMNLSGKAVIEDGKITARWTRDGQEKSFELTFNEELDKGCLYKGGGYETSYRLSLREDHTIHLNVGLNQAQWVLRKEEIVDESVVNQDAPDFERAFAGRKDWTASEETRNELAGLLFRVAAAGGVDPAAVRAEGPCYLALAFGNPDYPLLVCEGTGDYEHYLLSVGRGIDQKNGEPFVYYQWQDYFWMILSYPEKPVLETYREEIFPAVAGESIWQVRIDPDQPDPQD